MKLYARFVNNEFFVFPTIGFMFDDSDFGNYVFFGFVAWLFWQFAIEIEFKQEDR